MSFESLYHVRLVRSAVAEIQRRHGHLYSLGVFADLPEYGRNRPPRIGGYVPDVFALDAPETCRIIGEAKTPGDFETERSQQQISAFLSHLSVHPAAYFYLAIPWAYTARAAGILQRSAETAGAHSVSVIVIQGL